MILIIMMWSYIPAVTIFLPELHLLMAILFIHGLFFFAVPFLNHHRKYLASRIYFGFSAAIFLTIEALLAGPDASIHEFFYPGSLIPFFIYPRKQWKYMFSMVFLFVCCFFFAETWFIYNDPYYNITDQNIILTMQVSAKAGIIFCIIAISAYALSVISGVEKKLAIEHQKAEDLLHNILPEKIASRLRKGSESIADGFEYVSILFADIVGFTELSGKTRPDKLVHMLNSLFSRFDDLLDRYGLEKIKTIGDAYMVAAGIPEPREDHAERTLTFAIQMREEMKSFNSKFGTDLKIRIGINSGSVVAGVIGKKKFIYDLWGDSVNIASRMESNGIPGEIQVSGTTYELLKDTFNFKKRGPIDIKGKGMMETYILS